MIWWCSWNGAGVSLISKSWYFIQFMVSFHFCKDNCSFQTGMHHFERYTWWQRFQKINLIFFFLSRNITNFNPCRGLKLIIFLSIFSHRLLKEEQVQLSFSFWLPSCSEQLLLPQGTIPRARDLQTMENL